MKKFNLSKSEHVIVNVKKIIQWVVDIEKEENKLDDETIRYKYTHGYCWNLAKLVQTVLKHTTGQKVVVVKADLKIEGDLKNATGPHAYIKAKISGETMADFKYAYFDILGTKEHCDMLNAVLSPHKKELDQPSVRDEWEKGFAKVEKIAYEFISEYNLAKAAVKE